MEVSLKEISKIVTGNTPSKKNKDYWNSEDICFIKPDVIGSGIDSITTSNEYISNFASSKARIVDRNTILITCIGNIGRIGIVSDKKVAFNQQINAIIPDYKINIRYLAYVLLFSQPRLNALANSAVVPIVNKTQLGNFKVKINPNLESQRKIVSILDKIAKIIKNQTKEIEHLDELIKARFVEMFGDPISNNFNWNTTKLKNITSKITNGSTPKGGSKNYVNSGVMFLRSQNIWRNHIDSSDVVFISEKTNLKLQKSVLKNNDILITKTGRINTQNSSLGRAALYSGKDNSANINGHVYLIRLKNHNLVLPRFLVTILTGEAYRKYIRKVCVGGIDKRQINLNQVENFPIILPPVKKQQEFISLIQQVDKSKVAVQKSLDETQKLYDSLMQEYFG